MSFFQFLLEHSPLAVVVVGADGTIRYASPAFLEFLGNLPKNLADSEKYLHPDDVPRFQEALERVLKESGRKEEILLRTRAQDGRLRNTAVILWNCLAVPEVGGIIGYSFDLTKEVQLAESLAEERRLLGLLLEKIVALGEYTEVDDIAREGVRAICEVFGFALAWLGKKEEDFRVSVIAQYPPDHPYPQRIEIRWDESEKGYGPTGRAIREGKVQISQDMLENHQFAPWLGEAMQYGFRSSCAVPLMSRGETFGALNLYSTTPFFFTEERCRYLVLFARELASFLVASNAQRSLEQRVRELEAMRSCALRLRRVREIEEAFSELLEGMCTVVRADAGMIFFGEGESLTLVAQRGFSPSFGEVTILREELIAVCPLLETKSHLTDCVECSCVPVPKGFGPLLAVSLTSEEGPLGAIFLLRHEGRKPFTVGEARLAEMVADIGGNTVRRLLLYRKAQESLKRLQRLRTVDLAILGSFDLSLIFGVLTEEAQKERGVDAVAALILDPESKCLRCFAYRGFRKGGLGGVLLSTSSAILERIILERTPFVLQGEELYEDRSFARLTLEENFQRGFLFPMVSKGKFVGVLALFSREVFSPPSEWWEFFEAFAGQAALAVENAQLLENSRRALVSLEVAYDATIEGWAKALELRDRETEGHSERVTELTLRLAERMGVSGEELRYIRWGALLHDIGKLGVPDNILLKPGPLTEEEWATMRQHPLHAYEMLRGIPYLSRALDIPLYHHERFDGGGYPKGLKGKEIPLAARIFAVVDVYDALTNDRPYRKAWPQDKALEYIKGEAGKAFDPEVVRVFLEVVQEIHLR